MAKINKIITALEDWLKLQKLSPPIREFSSVGVLPPAAFPHIAINVEDEQFGPGVTDITALIAMKISHAGGRPTDTQASLRSLAHQVRSALGRSQCLEGSTRSLCVRAINYDNETATSADSLVIARAELLIELKYCENQF